MCCVQCWQLHATFFIWVDRSPWAVKCILCCSNASRESWPSAAYPPVRKVLHLRMILSSAGASLSSCLLPMCGPEIEAQWCRNCRLAMFVLLWLRSTSSLQQAAANPIGPACTQHNTQQHAQSRTAHCPADHCTSRSVTPETQRHCDLTRHCARTLNTDAVLLAV